MNQLFINELKGSFTLRKPKGSKPTNIYFVLFYNGRQYKVPTSVKIYPKHWDKKRQQAIISNKLSANDNQNNSIVNDRIKEMRSTFIEMLYVMNNEPNKEINILSFMAKKNEQYDMFGLMRQWVLNNPNAVSSTKNNYLEAIKRFEEYAKVHNIKKFEDIKRSTFRGDFQQWLSENTHGKKATTISKSAINHKTEYLYSILKFAVDNDYLTNSQYQDLKPVKLVVKQSNDEIILADKEVMAIYRYNTQKDIEEKAKDIFLLECTLGLRIGDILSLNESNFKEVDKELYMQKLTEKEKVEVNCKVLFAIAKEILEKYNYRICDIDINERQINYNIKQIAQKCGINEQIMQNLDTLQGNKQTYKNKWELISSHTGRRTFDAMLINRGFSVHEITGYSGHNEEMVERYTATLTPKDKAIYNETLTKHPEDLVRMCEDKQDYKDIMEVLFAESAINNLYEDIKNGFYIIQDSTEDIKKVVSAVKHRETDIKPLAVDPERYKAIEEMIFYIGWHTHDVALYRRFQVKCMQLGIIDSISTEEQIEELYYNAADTERIEGYSIEYAFPTKCHTMPDKKS